MPQIGIIFLENEGFAAVSATAAPKMHALTTQYMNLSNYNSTSHPSLPDYCAATAGSWLGKAGSDSGSVGFAGSHSNIFSAMAAKGHTWKSYEESVSQGSNYTSWTGSGTGTYASRHCPGNFYSGVDAKPGNSAPSGRFDFRGGPTGSLLDDMANKSLPDFFFIAPDLSNDGHDTGVTYADNWVAGKNPQSNSPAFPGIDALIAALRSDGCVLITFDNPGSSAGTHIYGCIVGPNVPAQTITTFHSHLTALFGVQQTFGIPKFTDSDEISAYASLTAAQALPWPTSSGPPPTGPSITSISPNSGPIGTAVTIVGSGFTGASSVTFGSTSATFSVVSSTQITATVPSLSDAVYTVNVTVSAQTASLVNSFTVTSAGGITGFSPTSGPVGTLVTINGTSGFVGVTSVAFNGRAAAFSVLSQTQIQATVPSGATTGLITVARSGGTLTSLSSFTVTSGGGGGGSPVTSLNLLIVPCQRTGTPLPGSLSTWQANMARVQTLWQTASYGQLALSYTFSATANLDPALPVNNTNALRGAALSWLAANTSTHWWTFDAIVYFGPDSLRIETGSGEGFIPAGVFGPYPGVDGETSPIFAAHEIGHLLGLNHAGLDTITPFAGLATLQTLEGLVDNSTIYGDSYDPMGANLYLSQPNAHAKNRLGWLGPRARTINTTGTYNLDALELASATNPQALVVSGQSGVQYWIEYRVPGATEDLDSAANTAAPSLFSPSGVTIRIRAGNTLNSDQNTDAQRSFILWAATLSQHQLATGQTFSDPGGSLQIHTVSAGASTASVQVTNPVAPTLVPQENLARPGGVSNLVVNTAASDSTHAALIWTHPVNATGVTAVYRDGTQIAILAAGISNYTDTVAAGSTHSYTVATNTAVGIGGPSSNLVTYTASNPVVGSKPAIPTSGAYYGLTAAVRNGRTAAQELAYVEGSTQAGRQVTVIHRYHNWDNPPLDTYELNSTLPRMLSVNWFAANAAGTFATWPDIANGVYDTRIANVATSFAAYGHPMWFCFHMEPENDTATCGTAADFVNAYRHVHGIIASAAPNVAFVWNLMASTFRAGTQAQWYPGDSYVDWTAADGYNWYNQGGHSDPWRSLSDIFSAFYNDSLTRNKPAMLAEYGTIDATNGGSGALSKGDWFTLALSIMKGWTNLKYAAYFNSQPFSSSPNWWFDDDPTGTSPLAYPRDKFKAMSNDAYFTPLFGGGGGGGGPASISTAPDSGTPGFFDPTFTAGSHKGRVDDVLVANNVVYVASSSPDVLDAGTTLTTVPNLTAFRRDTKRVLTGWRPAPNGRVYRLQQLGSSIIATGSFSTIGGQARGGIARFTPLSSVSDTSGFNLASTPGNLAADGAVLDVVFNTAHTAAWVAGDFSNIGGSARRGVARFSIASDGSWTLDTAFNANIPAFVAGGGGRCVVLKPDETKLVFGAHPGNSGTDVHTVPSLLALDPSTGASLTWANKIFYTLVANEHPGAFEMRGDAGGVYIGGLWNGGNSLCYFDWNGTGPNSVTIQANCNPTTASTTSSTTANCIWYFGCDGNVQTVGLVTYGSKQLVAAGHHGDVVANAKNHDSGTASSPGAAGNTTSHGLFLITAGAGGGTLDSYKNPPSFSSGADGDPLKLWAIYQDPVSGDLHVGGDFTSVNTETNDLHRRYAVFTAAGSGPPGDITPPTAPANLAATAESNSAIGLTWAGSTDNVGVTSYRIYRDGRLVGTVPGP